MERTTGIRMKSERQDAASDSEWQTGESQAMEDGGRRTMEMEDGTTAEAEGRGRSSEGEG